MKRNFTLVLAGICSLLVLPSTESKAQITLLNDYQNTSSAAIGTFQGINFREAGFSGLFSIPNTNGTEFWTISDRGVNVDAASANTASCRPTYDKIYGFPAYAPKIHRVRITGTSLQILQTITMKRPDGTPATGLLNPAGFGSTALEEVSTDTVLDCANFSSKIAAKDIWGIDSEGILVDKDGNFWICEEGGPTIWKLNSSGIVIKRYTPYANLAGAQPQDVLIDTVFKYRKNNRGFESITMAPNGKIYAIIQSPLLFPNTATGEGTRVHRILEIDPATNATRMLVYLNDGIIGASGSNQIRLRDWKIGDMSAINDSTFLVIEAAARGTSDIKRVYMININGATAVTSDLYSGLTVEGLVDSTGLANNAIIPVTKTLFLDLLANGWPSALDKAEGIAIINDSTLAFCNDNDYGQSSPTANGVATATSNLSHLIIFRLQGTNKIPNLVKTVYPMSSGLTGISSTQTPYLTAFKSGVEAAAVISAGDSASNGYKMAGTPDGLGAFDNGNGTFTLLMNHEFGATAGGIRAHGSKGAFVSKWVINKSDLSVVSGADLIQNVKLWNGSGYTTYNAGNPSTLAAFNRFCSADLPAISAYYNFSTALGTQNRIFMNGEEAGDNGRMFAHIVTGTEAGTTYELPHLGKFSAENLLANPMSQDKTIVAGTDDSTPGQVYMYVGTKTNTGTDVDKAGLTNGKLYGVAVTGLTTETSASVPAANTAFTLIDIGDVRDSSGTYINTRSNTLGVTTFLRPEDGAWDPSNPNDFYFATTNAFANPSRLWRLRFTNIATPELGGTITAVLDGTEGQKMLDNLTIDHSGHILLVEDVGNNLHNGKVWQYTIATDAFTQLAQHDSSRFVTTGAGFLTQDEEASGILDAQAILGPGKFLVVDQAHYAVAGDQVEGGQLLTLFNPDSYNGAQGASATSSQTPYLWPTLNGVKINSILTSGDIIGGYKMAGTPDGLGAFDNGDGTFTLLMNHEFGATAGGIRAHGSKGAFVSKWVINKSNLSVVSGADLIQNVKLWNGTSYTTYNAGNPSTIAAFNRFCSADLPAVSAYYNSTTGLGTQSRIFMNGEEAGDNGRMFAHIVTGTEGGTSYELPHLGKFSAENLVANPTPQDKTIVAGTDDSTPGQVYIYVGTKTNTGTDIDKAGLTNGKLYGVAVTGLTTETSASIPAANTAFTLIDIGTIRDSSGTYINTRSNTLGVTTFLRPEDGAWDPSNPNDFYFATTNAFASPSRLWRLRFTNIATPELGGTITAVLDGTEGQKMLDNITIDNTGHILLVEDVGNNAHNGKVWEYTIVSDKLKQLAQHDSTRFISGAPNFLTQDEEASGILDVQSILGPGKFLVVDQAHYAVAGDQVEGGQLMAFYNPDTYNAGIGAGPSSSQSPYLTPLATGVKVNSILTSGDLIGSYKMAGTPDGLGAFDNGNGTFTLLMNHEFGNTAGAVRAHGSKGAFVSKWVINKSDLTVVSGADLIQNVKLWNGSGYTTYNTGNPSTFAAFNRFCSADLPAVSAYYNSATGLGTQSRIFMNGEEAGDNGRMFAHIVTGTEAGITYELPHLGKFSAENLVANPTPQDKTIVAGMDDSTPGQVYIYVGTKTNTGTEVDKAGLTNGKLYGVAVTGLTTETSASVPAANSAFTLVDIGTIRDSSGTYINTRSNTLGVTTFLRPEDGSWDPSNPNDLYFATTNAFASPSRLWRLRFTNIATPELGGTITAVLDGTEGQKMLDNLTIDNSGHILMVEDVGNNAHNGKVWQYNIATDALNVIAQHDSSRFLTGAPNFLTQDEEASGILDAQAILGPGKFLVVDQAHYAVAGDQVEGGQLLTLYNPESFSSNPEIALQGNSVNIADDDMLPALTDNTNFGDLVTGVAQSKTFTIQNAGPGSLNVSGITFTGLQSAEFSLVSAPAFPLTIAAAGSQTITVKLTPAAAGVRGAIMHIINNDLNESSFDVALQGSVAPAEISIEGNNQPIVDGDVTPSSSDNTEFGNINNGSSTTKTFAIKNTGADTLVITAISVTGTNAAEFTLQGAPALPLKLAATTSQNITVKFMPTAAGSRTATINITNSDANEAAYDFSVQGTSVVPSIGVQGNGMNIADGDNTPITPDNTDFGNVERGSTETKTFEIKNTGLGDLTVTGISFTGTNASEFTLVSAPTFPLNVAAHNSQTITVQFAPTAIGTRSATINIANNDQNATTYDFALQGKGTIPTGVASLTSASFVKLYPNPAADEVTVSMTLKTKDQITVTVTDIQGKQMIAPVVKDLAAGEQQLTINTASLENGIYSVQISSGSKTTQIKLTILR